MSDTAQPFSPLIGAILTKMTTDAQFTTNTLISNLERENAELRAKLFLIREEVIALLSGDHMPMPHRILKALCPSEHEIDVLATEELQKEKDRRGV